MSGWGTSNYGDDHEDNNDDDDFAVQEDFETRWQNKDSVILAIDCGAHMMQASDPDNPDTAFQCALKCASSLLQDKIISSENDQIGVVLFGTQKTGNYQPSFAGVYILQDLDAPDAKRILEIEELQKIDFRNEYGFGNYQFSDLLWCCSMIFSNNNAKVGSKRIFLFTNEDNPHAGKPADQQAAKTKAKDLADLGMEIELFNMNKPKEKFDIDKFYADIITMEEDEIPGKYPDAAQKLSELQERVRRKEFKKRTLVRLPFHLTENLEISIRMYNLFMETKKGTPVNLDSQTNNQVKIITKYTTPDESVVSTKDLKYFYEFGGEKIVFFQRRD